MRSDRRNVAFTEQPLDPAMAGGGAGVDPLGDIRVGEPAVGLKKTQDFEIGPVEIIRHERILQI